MGETLFAVGVSGRMHALDKSGGRVQWQALDFKNSYSSPTLATIAGEEQLIVFMAEELIGVDPDDGRLRWRFPHANQWGHNISTPVIDGDRIFISSPQVGTRGLRLIPEGDTIRVEQVWSTRRIQFYHATAVRDGDWVYGTIGTMAPAFMTAVNLRTGEIAWRERGFSKANCVYGDGKMIILDEDGNLALATATPEGLTVHSKCKVAERYAWATPTLVGATLYVRDRKHIMALDLS